MEAQSITTKEIADRGALSDFVRATDIWSKWDAARRLMAARLMQSAVSQEGFVPSFNDVGRVAIAGSGQDQLLAIALIVRISELVKGDLKRDAAGILSQSLAQPIAGLWTISEARHLPLESKPSEIRENIALALSHASGSWVVPYIVEALAREEKSSRCRVELTRQLADRGKRVTVWLQMLSDIRWSDIAETDADRAGRLKDLLTTLAIVLRERRLLVMVDDTAGPALAKLVQQILPISHRSLGSAKIAAAALAVVELLDELLTAEFTLIAEPDAYAALAVIHRWWQPSSYPLPVTEGLRSINKKLMSAIRLRARLGQKSETLALRLRQAVGNPGAAAGALIEIAETESGLSPEIDDWLHARERSGSPTAAAVTTLLSRSGHSGVTEPVAGLLLDCVDAAETSSQSDSTVAGHLRRICGRIQALAAELNLKPVGNIGETVEYNPHAHRTISGKTPSEPLVRLLRPMIVRQRADGSQDIVERATVEGLSEDERGGK